MPKHRFDPCVIRPAVVVDKLQTVAFDTNRYSVPRSFAFGMVTVKGFVDKVVIVANGQIIASHQRSLKKQTMILDPIHYLATLGKKPGALDHSPVFRDWKLPACFAEFRVALEQLHGAMSGSRRFVQVLQLMGEHPMPRVSQAIQACRRDQLHSAEAVIQRTRSLGAIEATKRDVTRPEEPLATLRIDAPLPDLGRFNQLMSSSDADNPVSVIFT